MERATVALLALAIIASVTVLGMAEKRALLPGGIVISPGGLAPGGSLIVYSRGEAGLGDLVVVCTGQACFHGNVTGHVRRIVAVDGDRGSAPAPVPANSRGLYPARALVPAHAWIPPALLLGGLFAAVVWRSLGPGYAVLASWLLAVVLAYGLVAPLVYTGVLETPRAEARYVGVTKDYKWIFVDAELSGGNFTDPRDCRLIAGRETYRVPGYAAGPRIEAPVPASAWVEAAEYYKSRLVFLTLSCRTGLEGVGDDVIRLRVTASVVLPEPVVEKGEGYVAIKNPSPVPVRLVATIVYLDGSTVREKVNTTIQPMGEYRVELGDHRKMILEGEVIAPWGAKPVGAILP